MADETRRSSEHAASSSKLASPDSSTSTLTQVGEDRADGKTITHQNEPQLENNQNSDRQVAQRSRWQAVLLEAGGLGAAFSDENMRRLKYCLHCLQVRRLLYRLVLSLTFSFFVVRNGANRRADSDSSGFHCRSTTITSYFVVVAAHGPAFCAVPRVTGTYANVD
jgi:hypothetical protein